MLTSRNLHFAVLGVILGASAGYVVAFHRADVPASEAALPANHPSVNPGANPEAASIEALKEVAERSPENAAVWARYGYALLQAKRAAEAAVAFERSIQIRPDDIEVRSLLGAVYWKEGRPEEARKHLQAAIKQDPRDIPTLHALFLITLEDDRDPKKAAELLKTIESLDPAYRGLPDLKERLKGQNGPSGN